MPQKRGTPQLYDLRQVDLFQITVGIRHVGYAGPGKFLRKPPLMRPEGALRTATRFGESVARGAKPGGDVLDAELLERAPYLGQVILVHLAPASGV